MNEPDPIERLGYAIRQQVQAQRRLSDYEQGRRDALEEALRIVEEECRDMAYGLASRDKIRALISKEQ